MGTERVAPNDKIRLVPIFIVKPLAGRRCGTKCLIKNLNAFIDTIRDGVVSYEGYALDTPTVSSWLVEVDTIYITEVRYIGEQLINEFIPTLKVVAAIVKP